MGGAKQLLSNLPLFTEAANDVEIKALAQGLFRRELVFTLGCCLFVSCLFTTVFHRKYENVNVSKASIYYTSSYLPSPGNRGNKGKKTPLFKNYPIFDQQEVDDRKCDEDKGDFQ